MPDLPRPTVLIGPPAAEPRVRRHGPEVRFGHLEVYAAIAGLSYLAARFVPVLGLFPGCPFRAALGIPCATCGMTHAFVALAHGHFTVAVVSSPLGALAAAGAWGFAAVAALRRLLGFRWPALGPRAARAAALAGVAALLVNWGWLVVAGRPHP